LDPLLISRLRNIFDDVHQSVCIVVHTNPDGDAIGSALALYGLMKKIGFEDLQVVAPNSYAAFLHWMPYNEQVIIAKKSEQAANEAIKKAQLLFCLDFNGFSRTDQLAKHLKKSNAFKVMVDHHPSPEAGFDLVFSDPSASSTAELVYEAIESLGLKDLIDQSIAECLYAAIVTDTGSFSFSCNNPRTYDIVAELMRLGIDGAAIQRLIYSTYSLDRMRLLGYCLSEKLKVIDGHQAAYIGLTKQELAGFNHKEGDTEGIVNYALSLKGVNLAAMFIENDDHIKASFRSAGEVNVNLFARLHYEGGGHQNAAGGKVYFGMEEALMHFEALVKKGAHK